MGNIAYDSANIFFSPLTYSISGPYYLNMSLHINTLLVFKLLHVMFSLSVYIINILPSNIVLNYFRFSSCLADPFLLLYTFYGNQLVSYYIK